MFVNTSLHNGPTSSNGPGQLSYHVPRTKYRGAGPSTAAAHVGKRTGQMTIATVVAIILRAIHAPVANRGNRDRAENGQ